MKISASKEIRQPACPHLDQHPRISHPFPGSVWALPTGWLSQGHKTHHRYGLLGPHVGHRAAVKDVKGTWTRVSTAYTCKVPSARAWKREEGSLPAKAGSLPFTRLPSGTQKSKFFDFNVGQYDILFVTAGNRTTF